MLQLESIKEKIKIFFTEHKFRIISLVFFLLFLAASAYLVLFLYENVYKEKEVGTANITVSQEKDKVNNEKLEELLGKVRNRETATKKDSNLKNIFLSF